jgi:hypothetical protein
MTGGGRLRQAPRLVTSPTIVNECEMLTRRGRHLSMVLNISKVDQAPANIHSVTVIVGSIPYTRENRPNAENMHWDPSFPALEIYDTNYLLSTTYMTF